MARGFLGVLLAAAIALLTHEAPTTTLALRLHDLDDFRGNGYLLSLSTTVNGSVIVNATDPAVKEAYFDAAIVDHSAPLSERTYWKQRYFINDEFWAGRDYPVFMYIGGEGPLGPRALTNRNFIHYLAKQHRALLVAVEHRFYGKSYPTPDMSTRNLRFLSSRQALEDLARFHTFLTDKYGLENAKWVGFGGSYPGNLAAWVKLKYPALFAGTVASSAPLLAKTNFFEYMEVVGDGLRYFGGGECYRRVEQSIVELRALLDGGREGREKVQQLFAPCYPMVNEFDDSVFESSVMGAFQDIAQYNGLKEGAMTLADVCGLFTGDETKPVIQVLADFLAKTRGTKSCLDSKFQGEKNATIETLQKSDFDGESSSRQWFYQTCNEFGYFQTTTSAATPFHALKTVTMENTGLEVCKRVFGIKESPDVKSTNVEYGALGITVENVTFPSGTIDPWHALAVKNSTYLHSSTAQSVYIEGTAHCADMYHPKDNDSVAIQWAHAKIAANVARYLGAASGGAAATELAIE
jgi:thymus-specific serine protease